MLVVDCAVAGCMGKPVARGWCNKHYQRWKATGDPLGSLKYQRESEQPLARFMRFVSVDADRCWLWTGAVAPNGYARFGVTPSVTVDAHRWFYEQMHGPIDDGLVVHHCCHVLPCVDGVQCKHRRCVNPAHLMATTQAKNIEAGTNIGRPRKVTP